LKPTILLVEDSKVQKLANQKILIAAGYLVLLAANGEEAFTWRGKRDPT
jgi:CheY-like chemotaxis protein